MAKIIEITSSQLKGNRVKRGIGQRVAQRTIRHLKPNMQQFTDEQTGVTFKASAKNIKTIKKWLEKGMSPDHILAKFTNN